MNKFFWTIPHKLDMGLTQTYGGYTFDWKKLLLVISVLSTTGVLLIWTTPYPSTILLLSPPVTVSSYRTWNSADQVKVSLNSSDQVKVSQPPQARLEFFPPLAIAPINPLSRAASHVPLSAVEESAGINEVNSSPNITGAKDIKTEFSNESKALDQPNETISAAGVNSHLRTEKHVWPLTPDQALVHAKHEIADAVVVIDDPELYGPVFRNVSVFKRSYELMENILKVYIYPDGAKPIFHNPHLKGIYASEGWFMKLMEKNRQFVVKDPNTAHLFYLPYSAFQLEVTLYVPNSHALRPLSLFLKDYVNMIAAKYPFWNRTRGSDHFLVACHDWGPYTLTEHDELSKNTIKALCNADVSEGIFKQGKDVSLPETTIRTPKSPLRDIGGKPVSQRSILAFFAGRMHGRVRPILVKYWLNQDPDMRIYGPLPRKISKTMSYIQHMKSSKFCICPMGYEVNSPRIVEAIYYECVPVIIADNFVPPFDEVLDWSKFSIIVPEKDIPKLKEILAAIPMRRYMSMQMGVKRVQKHFLWHHQPVKFDLFHMILHSVWYSRLNQIHIQ